jgi:hypothetical protein
MIYINVWMFFECKICGYFTNDNNSIHKCIDDNKLKIEKFKRFLMSINIFPKKYVKKIVKE